MTPAASSTSRSSYEKCKALFGAAPARGAWIGLPTLASAEILASAGFEFLVLDCEHGPAGEETLMGQILAAERRGAAAIVRPPEARDPWIKRALDLGAGGVMAPSVDTVADAQRAVAAFRYGPAGRRGVATRLVRAADYGRDSDYERRWNHEGVLIAQIEGPEGVEAAAEIARVDGVDALFFGPSDFAARAGYPSDAEITEAYCAVAAAAKQAGKLVGATPFATHTAHDLLANGAEIVTVTSDVSLLRRGAAAALAAARDAV